MRKDAKAPNITGDSLLRRGETAVFKTVVGE